MKYGNMVYGIFRERPNRFIALVEINGKTERCHVKNTGRCRELLVPGAEVWLEESRNPARKTRWSLITVKRSDGELVNLDSQAPNEVTQEWLRSHAREWQLTRIAREQTKDGSRFDFALGFADGTEGYLEVKGVTLNENGIARFPDAPTVRGARHVRDLARGQREGLVNAVLFVIAMKGVTVLKPNDRTHEDFGRALREAAEAGVRILAVDCRVGTGSLAIDRWIPVDLTPEDGSERS